MVDQSPALRCLLVSDEDVARVLDVRSCLDAVEEAFRASVAGDAIAPSSIGVVTPMGSFHVKSAVSAAGSGGRRLFVAKVNGNFPGNGEANGLPTIQGLLVLCDADTGVPLMVADSTAITVLRTAAATGVAANYLARADARTTAVIGCGMQAPAQVEAICAVRKITRLLLFDRHHAAAVRCAHVIRARLGLEATVADSVDAATRDCHIVVTATTSQVPFLDRAHIAPGCFVAAVGADNPHKQEIAPSLMASSVVITDSTKQCATMGDLHHAVAAGAMSVDGVRAELGTVIADPSRGRHRDDEVIIFDSTGVAFQDVASASVTYGRLVGDARVPAFAFRRGVSSGV